MPDQTAQLTIDNRTYHLPVIAGTTGEKALDIRGLLRETGYITMDSGFMNTGSCQSQITYLDGDKGSVIAPTFST
jgi:citrate synthase